MGLFHGVRNIGTDSWIHLEVILYECFGFSNAYIHPFRQTK